MIPASQLHGASIDGKLGDCWRACLASILEISPIEIPHFAELYGIQRMTFETDLWLRERAMRLRFLELVNGSLRVCSVEADGTWQQVPEPEAIPGYLILGGWAGARHSVVASTDALLVWLSHGRPGNRPPFVHDPHPSRAGILGLKNVWALVSVFGRSDDWLVSIVDVVS
jgi:hypothetical protein